ncbi:MAG: hypothetical protein HQ492_02500 [Woeseiaceae bacterium]|nr:hypothetical protein [Woeseiaceae bacterium]
MRLNVTDGGLPTKPVAVWIITVLTVAELDVSRIRFSVSTTSIPYAFKRAYTAVVTFCGSGEMAVLTYILAEAA